MRTRFALHGTFLLSLLALVTAAGCESLRRRIRHGQPPLALNIEEKIRLTRESAAAFENSAGGLYPCKDLHQYVQNVGDRVVKAIPPHHPREYPFTFRVLNTKTINACALPGGYIYVTRGLLEEIKNEDELAAVLACQVAHVTMSHFDDRFLEILLANLGLGVPVVADSIAGENESTVSLPDETVVAINVRRFRFTAEDESEAGAVALQYIARTRYYLPHSVINVPARLDSLRPGRDTAFPSWGYTHPAPSRRREELNAILEQEYPEFAVGGKPVPFKPVLKDMRRAGETFLRVFEKAESEKDIGLRMVAYGFPKSGRAMLESVLKQYDIAIAGARESGIEAAVFYSGRALAYKALFDVTGGDSFRKKARADFDDAKRIDSQNYIARLFRGYYFLKVDGFYGRAEKELLEAARLNPGTEYRGLPYLYLADLYDTPAFEGHDEGKAAHYYEIYLVMDPLGKEVRRVMERLKVLRPDSKIPELFRDLYTQVDFGDSH